MQAFLQEADLPTCAAIDVRAWTPHGLALLGAVHPPIVVPTCVEWSAEDGGPRGRRFRRVLRYLTIANFATLAALQQAGRPTDRIPVLCLDARASRAQVFELLQASLLGMPALYRTTEGAPAAAHGAWKQLISVDRGIPVRNLLDSDRSASFCAATGFSPQSIGPSTRRTPKQATPGVQAAEGPVDPSQDERSA